MIKISVLYPKTSGARFDMNYNLGTHIPMVRQLLGGACKGIAVEQGIAGASPGSAPPFAAMNHLYFDSVDVFQTAFGPHARDIMGDLQNFTDISPVVQVSEVKL